MSISDVGMLFHFAGGLGFFLYGMNQMADGLQKSAGNKMKNLLGYLTNNRMVAILVGTLVTAIIQSSSATTVMVVGFVNAGIMDLTQAVGVIMGANIGTTVTAWIVSLGSFSSVLKPEFFAPLLVGIGAFVLLFCKSGKKRDIGEILIGFGALFIGLSFMSGAIEPYRDAPVFSDAFRLLGSNPILGLLAGFVVTGIIQSSSASVGILQTLAMNGMVTWNSAVYITLGQNIGTCVTALISSVGTGKNAKRAAVIHLLFNIIGAVLMGLFMFGLFSFEKEFAASKISSVEISIFHTIFNIANTIVLLPFGKLLVKLSGMIVKGEDEIKEDDAVVSAIRHMDDRILETPSFAVETVKKEVVSMGRFASEHFSLAVEALKEKNIKKIKKVRKMEQTMDRLAELTTEYLVKVSNLSLSNEQHLVVNYMFNAVTDIERIGDHCDNLAELAEKYSNDDSEFSEKATKGLDKIFKLTQEAVDHSLDALEKNDIQEAKLTETCEQQVDMLEKELRKAHMKRLSNKQCNATKGIIFLDALTNIERVSDHAMNVADYILEEK